MSSATLEQPSAVPSSESSAADRAAFARRLQDATIGVSLSVFSLSCRRTMGSAALAKVADLFDAEKQAVGGSRQVINRKHELVKPVFHILIEAKALVYAHTMDYPEKGIRLIKRDRVNWLVGEIRKMQEALATHLQALDEGWESVKADAKQRIGDLYNEGDYPARPSSGFGLELSFPAIKPDDRLAKMHPELYEEQRQRIAARFSDAVAKTEAVAAEQLGKLLEHLVERLAPGPDGAPKMLHETTVTNLVDFVGRFRDLSIGSNAQLEQLVDQVEKAASGLDAKAIRKTDAGARTQLAEQFSKLREQIDSLVIDRPVREIDVD